MLKEPAIRSEQYTRGAKDSPCRFRGPTCNADPSTSQFAHMNGAVFGKGAMHKAHDVAGIDACSACHAYIDVGHGTHPLISDAEFWRMMCRALVETMVDRIRRGIVVVRLDPERLSSERHTPPRKPPKERAKINSRGFQQGPSRPIPSRPFRSKEKA